MFNMIKMDLYRMFHTKAMYIVWIIMAAALLLSTSLLKEEVTDSEIQQENYEYAAAGERENVNMGMSVTLSTKPGEKVTLYDVVYANVNGKFFTLFIVIFAVIFATADLNSGYIKNFGGQVKNRPMLIVSKGIALGIYTVLTTIIFLGVQAASNIIFLGYLKLGPAKELLSYMGTEIILHWAMALIVMTLAIIIRSNAFSMVLAICLCMNMMTICYSVVDKWIHAAGIENFSLLNYTITGKISMLAMEPSVKSIGAALLVGAGFIIGASALGCLVFQKRDIQ